MHACWFEHAHAYVSALAQEHQWTAGIEKYKKREVLSTGDVRLMGACHIALGAACLGAFH